MVTFDLILDIVSEQLNVPKNEIRKDRMLNQAKQQDTVWARQICMSIANEYRLGSLEKIGQFYGGRTHATVIHALKVVGNEYETDANRRMQIINCHTKVLKEAGTRNTQKGKELLLAEFELFQARAKEIVTKLSENLHNSQELINIAKRNQKQQS